MRHAPRFTLALSFLCSASAFVLRGSFKHCTVLRMMPLPKGSLVALVTPMNDEGGVDQPTLRSLLQWHKKEGTDGVVVLGTTGEASGLSLAEKETVISVTKEEVGGDIPIIVGTGTISTAATIEATKHAKSMGADACLVATPYYVKPSQAGLLAHFSAIADAVDLPMLLYNVPGRTGVDLSVETSVALSRHRNICGLKDATGDNSRVAPMRTLCGPDFMLYSGEDAMAREFVLQGGDGVISVTANVAPGAVSRVMHAANSGDATGAEVFDGPLSALHRDLFCEGNPIPVKWAMQRCGALPQGALRLPLVPLSEKFHARVETALTAAGLLEDPSISQPAGGMHGRAVNGGWPSVQVLLQGHLFDSGLINQALELIEKRGGDFALSNFSAQPNDVNNEFNFKRLSSVQIQVYGVDSKSLHDIITRLETLISVMESAEGVLTVVRQSE